VLKTLKLGEETRARIIVGHVRPDRIDEVGEHCDITFSFFLLQSAWGLDNSR
jgi:hypothetical protein